MARRAASIWRAVTRSGSSAFNPYWPKCSSKPAFEAPRIRPLKALRNFVRLGCNMVQTLEFFQNLRMSLSGSCNALGRVALAPPATAAATVILLGHLLVLRHRIVLEDLALEDPDLDAAGAIGGMRRRRAVIDIGAQRM